MAEKALPTLDLSGPSSQVANNWKKWKRAFEYYAEGKGLDNTRKKTSQLLHYTGMGYKIFSKILSTPIQRAIKSSMWSVLGSLIIIFALTKIFHLSATCSGSWRRRMANRLINLLCVSVDRQGTVILVILSMTTYESS